MHLNVCAGSTGVRPLDARQLNPLSSADIRFFEETYKGYATNSGPLEDRNLPSSQYCLRDFPLMPVTLWSELFAEI